MQAVYLWGVLVHTHPSALTGPAPCTPCPPPCTQLDSFVHLHLGIDAAGLDPDMECHHLMVNDWKDITSHQNVLIASVPTVFDPAMAPKGTQHGQKQVCRVHQEEELCMILL